MTTMTPDELRKLADVYAEEKSHLVLAAADAWQAERRELLEALRLCHEAIAGESAPDTLMNTAEQKAAEAAARAGEE